MQITSRTEYCQRIRLCRRHNAFKYAWALFCQHHGQFESLLFCRFMALGVSNCYSMRPENIVSEYHVENHRLLTSRQFSRFTIPLCETQLGFANQRVGNHLGFARLVVESIHQLVENIQVHKSSGWSRLRVLCVLRGSKNPFRLRLSLFSVLINNVAFDWGCWCASP